MKILNLNEMYDILVELKHPDTDVFRGMLEIAGNIMARQIAAHLNVTVGRVNTEGAPFAGTCATFKPTFVGQECPELIHAADPGGDWE
jgi:hypothetical protein